MDLLEVHGSCPRCGHAVTVGSWSSYSNCPKCGQPIAPPKDLHGYRVSRVAYAKPRKEYKPGPLGKYVASLGLARRIRFAVAITVGPALFFLFGVLGPFVAMINPAIPKQSLADILSIVLPAVGIGCLGALIWWIPYAQYRKHRKSSESSSKQAAVALSP